MPTVELYSSQLLRVLSSKVVSMVNQAIRLPTNVKRLSGIRKQDFLSTIYRLAVARQLFICFLKVKGYVEKFHDV